MGRHLPRHHREPCVPGSNDYRGCLSRRLLFITGAMVMLVAGCGTEAQPETPVSSSTTPATNSSLRPTADGSSTVTRGQNSPTVVTFDGEVCSLSGSDVLERGLVSLLVDNQSSNPAEVVLYRLTDGLEYETVEADVRAGAFDLHGKTGWVRPPGVESGNPLQMPANTDAPVPQTIAAQPGTWIAICLDLIENRAYLAASTLDIS